MRASEIIQANEYRKAGIQASLGLIDERLKQSGFAGGTPTNSFDGRQLIQKALEKTGVALKDVGTDASDFWATLLNDDSKFPADKRLFSKEGTELAIYQRDEKGRIQYDKEKKPIVKTIPINAEFVTNVIERTKGWYRDWEGVVPTRYGHQAKWL